MLHGELSLADEEAVSAWIALNEAALLAYWNGAISTVEFVTMLAKLWLISWALTG